MAGEIESQEACATPATGVDAAAAMLALGTASREKADAFLDDQRALIADQRHHLKEQFKQLPLALWEKRMGVALRVGTMAVGLAVAVGIAAMIWSASRSNELIVDSFSVPPDLAQKGVSGQVLAGQLVDRLTEMQEQTTTFRAAQTYSSNFGDSIKLEIPETGISFAELNRFLRETLGDNKHISGALIHTGAGLKLSVRVSGGGSDSVDGAESELDALVQRAADAIYSRTQPFRYATYIWTLGHRDEAHRLLLKLANAGSASERSWGFLSVGTSSVDAEGDGASDEALKINTGFEKRAVELNPSNALAWSAFATGEELLGHNENALIDFRRGLAALSGDGAKLLRPEAVPLQRLVMQARVDGLLGRFDMATHKQIAFSQSGSAGLSVGISSVLASYQASGHESSAAEATLAEPVPESATRAMFSARYTRRSRIQIALLRKDWNGVLRAAALVDPREPQQQTGRYAIEDSWVALAKAGLGRIADAEVQIGKTPGDCYPCLIARAQIAELQGQHGRADFWFARAEQSAPSTPFADESWGRAFLTRGDPDAAIVRFERANRKGPHFADPLEGWGEALMAKNQSHLALAKFAEAEKYAPNWGRLHLKWGEALVYAGKKEDARKQFARAAQLDLTPFEKSELARQP